VASERSLSLVGPRTTLVDTCVLVDIILEDPIWCDWSADALTRATDGGPVVINPIIYAEICAGYDRIEDVDDVLPETNYIREPFPYGAAFLTAQAFKMYRKNGGTRSAPLADFYIGAHAAVNDYDLLTRDPARFSTYFPRVRLVTPE
jgi:predicted nucleic acid-binding protein